MTNFPTRRHWLITACVGALCLFLGSFTGVAVAGLFSDISGSPFERDHGDVQAAVQQLRQQQRRYRRRRRPADRPLRALRTGRRQRSHALTSAAPAVWGPSRPRTSPLFRSLRGRRGRRLRRWLRDGLGHADRDHARGRCHRQLSVRGQGSDHQLGRPCVGGRFNVSVFYVLPIGPEQVANLKLRVRNDDNNNTNIDVVNTARLTALYVPFGPDGGNDLIFTP